MGKFVIGSFTLVLVVSLMGIFPGVAVAVTAISIVGLFMLGKD